jgi:hypothetical protein
MRFIYLFTILIFGLNGFSQNIGEYYVKPDSSGSPIILNKSDNSSPTIDKRPFSDNKRIQVAFQTGASFSTMGNNSIFNTWVAPEIKYQVTPKFSLTAGTVAMYGNYGNLQNYISKENSLTNADRLAQYYLFAKGEYKLNDRITFRGTTMKEVSNTSINPNPYSLNHLGIDIKLRDNVFLSADVQVAKGRTPFGMYYNNPYNPSFGYGNSFFSSSPFSSINRGW